MCGPKVIPINTFLMLYTHHSAAFMTKVLHYQYLMNLQLMSGRVLFSSRGSDIEKSKDVYISFYKTVKLSA